MSYLDVDFSDDDTGSIVSEEIRKAAAEVSMNLLPDKSKRLYTAAYNAFKKWRREKGSNSFCEDVLLAYFAHLSTNYSPPSLWSIYSMLKCSIKAYDKININCYARLIAFIKKQSVGYRPKKSQIFTTQNITKFFNEAPDQEYLCHKVIMIFGIAGALRREEFVDLTTKDVVLVNENEFLVKINKTKNNVPRSFVISGTFFDLCTKYVKFRPAVCETDKFFLRYWNGKCSQQSIGINKFGSMPKIIASYLKLPDAEGFTGHSLRRTSATLLVDAGAELTELMRHGGWKSSAVASGYIADSIGNKRKICQRITSGIEVKRVAISSEVVPDNLSTFEISKLLAPSRIFSQSVLEEVPQNIGVIIKSENVLESFETCTASKHTFAPNKIQAVNFLKPPSVNNVNFIPKNSLTESAPSVQLQYCKKDNAVQTVAANKGGSVSEKNLQLELPKQGSIFYDQDIGLYVLGSTDENFNSSC